MIKEEEDKERSVIIGYNISKHVSQYPNKTLNKLKTKSYDYKLRLTCYQYETYKKISTCYG